MLGDRSCLTSAHHIIPASRQRLVRRRMIYPAILIDGCLSSRAPHAVCHPTEHTGSSNRTYLVGSRRVSIGIKLGIDRREAYATAEP